MKYPSQIYNGYKICSKCGCILPVIMFHKSSKSKSGLRYRCKDCEREYRKKYLKENKEKI